MSKTLVRTICAWISITVTAAAPRVTTSSVAELGALALAPSHFANTDAPEKVTAGKLLYAQRCSSCHGKRLQGQSLWQLQDQYSHRRAPALDESGHMWAHSDEELFHITRDGRFTDTPPNVRSYMPAFGGILNDEQILDVMAFIKARWPLGLRISQSLLNPGYAGMPANTDARDWTFPPTCSMSAQRWRAESR